MSGATETGENMNLSVKQLSIQRPYRMLVAIVFGITAMPATSVGHQDLKVIHDVVVDFVVFEHSADIDVTETDTHTDLQVRPGALDARLRLADCSLPLTPFWAPGSKKIGNTTVGVRCAGERPWKLFIPTRVQLMKLVVVANRPLLRGQHLSALDLRSEKRDVGRLRRAAIFDPAQVLGYRVKRAIAPGRVVDGAMLEAPVLVERGRRVRIAVRTADVAISMSGEAIEDGALGDTVKIRNTSSRKVIEGVVTGHGTVRVHLAGPPIKR
ncbi:MAG: flagella basal body P-ring formation protein FlgA [Gammaproteobacteria bacterium]